MDAGAGMPAVRRSSGPDAMEEVVDALIEASHRLDRKRAIAQERRLADALVQVVEFAERLGRWVRTDVVSAAALRHVVDLAEKLRDACQDIEAWARCEEKALADLRGPAEALPPNDVGSGVRFDTPHERTSGNDPILESAPRLAVERENASPRGGQALHARAERRFDLASFLYGSASLAAGAVLCLAIVLLRQPDRTAFPRPLTDRSAPTLPPALRWDPPAMASPRAVPPAPPVVTPPQPLPPENMSL